MQLSTAAAMTMGSVEGFPPFEQPEKTTTARSAAEVEITCFIGSEHRMEGPVLRLGGSSQASLPPAEGTSASRDGVACFIALSTTERPVILPHQGGSPRTPAL